MKRREFIKTGAAGSVLSATGLNTGSEEAVAAQSDSTTEMPLVGLAGSNDTALSQPVALDEKLTTEQVRELVWLALDRDTSPKNLHAIIKADHWVVVKPNLVTCPVTMKDFHAEGIEHWWLMTDLRVVKAVVEYIVEKIGPRRLSIAEGPPWNSSGGRLKPESFVDGWHCKWREFGDLSYAEFVEAINDSQSRTTVDIIDLNEDEPVYVENFDPNGTSMGAYQDVRPKDSDGTSETEWTQRKGIYFPKTLIDSDILISVPVLKTHSSAGVTLGIKNLVGCIHSQVYNKSNGKAMIHQGSQFGLVRGVADLGTSMPIHYTVAEGVWATVQQHLGQNGVGINHNVIVCGGDVVATEAVSMMVMGYHPLDADLLRLMHMKNMGEWRPDRIDIAGPPVRKLRRNFARAADTYFARGIRKWLTLGPLKDRPEKISDLKAVEGAQFGKARWEYLDGDAILDAKVNVSKPYRYNECLYYEIPGSEKARTGTKFYLALTASTERKDLCGQILAGSRGGTITVFFNGKEISYPRDPQSYNPTPAPFLKFREGENTLILELEKTAGKNEPVKIAANLCDLDGDRLEDISLAPDNEKLVLPSRS